MNPPSRPELENQLQQLQLESCSLLIYRSILLQDLAQAFVRLLSALSDPTARTAAILNCYGQWFEGVTATSGWQGWIEQQVMTANNAVSQRLQYQGLEELPASLLAATQRDLDMLQRWVTVAPRLIQGALAAKTEFALPTLPEDLQDIASASELWNLAPFNFSAFESWSEALPALAHHYRRNGVGLFAQYVALRWRDQSLEGIEHPEFIPMEALVGYADQQAALRQNTEALLAGSIAQNVLLYGSRGSGKSALVKSLLTRYGRRGLRLIELSKAEMIHLPQIVEMLRPSSLKFVIFVDDLSFEEDEESYKALKVVLEGTLTARPQNVVVYATSNRRHLIREFFGDRPPMRDADEVHTWDTVQEKLSLSDRFGLTLTFEPANQETYLEIVRSYAHQFKIKISEADLTHQALQWAVRHNVRSGRTARQFIDQLRAKQALQAQENT